MIDLLIKNAKYLNVFTKEFIISDIAIDKGKIIGFSSYDAMEIIDLNGKYVVPGFIDSHIHLESSMVSPVEFLKIAYKHGTSLVVCDPHEIANVCGNDGIEYMLEATKNQPVDVYFMVPSCVPASMFDETGYVITRKDINTYLKNDRFLGLAEMMNYPGVIYNDKDVIDKISITLSHNKIIDGHAPLLSGKNLEKYVSSNIYSDHECSSYNEALEKIRLGVNIMVREGTASKNLNGLIDIIKKYPNRCMFSTDDKHPSDILNNGHIDHIIREAIAKGVDIIDAYICASYNPSRYFRLYDRGAIALGYKADLVILNDLKKCDVDYLIKNGKIINDNDFIYYKPNEKITNTINFKEFNKKDIELKKSKVIGLVKGEIITKSLDECDSINIKNDILKLCVIERHHNTGHIGLAYIKGYGLKSGAIGTTIAHDSHNIIIVGCNDLDIINVANRLKEIKGGIVISNNNEIISELSLPIAGLMTNINIEDASKKLNELKEVAYSLKVNKDIDPFMTLSFVSLPVIPELKLTTKGLVDVNNFRLI